MGTWAGYWTAKLATESSPITSQNTITLVDDDEVVDGSGYESMVNAVSRVEFYGGDDSGDDITTTMTLGYANDLVKSTLVNPLGHTGLSYCMCLALMAGCDPKQSGAVIPASPIKTAAFELDGDTSDSTDYELENYIAETSRSNSADTPLFEEGEPALKAEYTALGVQTLAAFSLTGTNLRPLLRPFRDPLRRQTDYSFQASFDNTPGTANQNESMPAEPSRRK